MVLTTSGSQPNVQDDNPRRKGLPDPKTQALLDAIGTPTKSVKAGAKSKSGKGK
jgi:hypothetical protein